MIERIDNYINYANYCTLSLMYTNSNGIKKYGTGHFGCSYGINFILGHLYDFYNRNNLTHREVIGTGHAGVSLITNLWLSNCLDNYPVNQDGFDKLRDDFGKIIRTEINSSYPYNIYDGGELGYSLSNAYGYALDNEIDIVACIIGDGEAETGSITSSYYLSKILKTKSKVLPIINLNGYKMGSSSILSMYKDSELKNYYTSLGYNVFIVDNNSKDMYEVLEKVLEIDNPLIVLKSPKGYKGYDCDTIKISGSIISHKDPLKNIEENRRIDIINKWIDSYHIKLFDEKFYKTIYNNKYIEDKKTNNKLIINNNKYNSNMEYLDKYLNDNNILIFSPDEIRSNKISSLNVIEMLNENVINGVYQGYTSSGNKGIFIGYEGFMSIISSMVNQYLKSMLQNNNLNSMTYILSSTWEENTYSHQSPSFVDELLLHDSKHINIYYPMDGKSLVYYTNKSLESDNSINVIVSSKGKIKQYNYDLYNDIMVIEKEDNYRIVLVATGDYMLEHIIKVSKLLKNKDIYCKIIYVSNISILNKMENNIFYSYFDIDKPIIYCYHGYSNTIKAYLFNRLSNIDIRGYSDLSYITGSIEDKIAKNNMKISDLEKHILEVLHEL